MSKSLSLLLERFAERYNEFGTNLKFVTNCSQEGAQFVKVFGVIGRLLRYNVDFTNLGSADDDEDEFFSGGDDIGQFTGSFAAPHPVTMVGLRWASRRGAAGWISRCLTRWRSSAKAILWQVGGPPWKNCPHRYDLQRLHLYKTLS
jgi:hypothetical protein